MSWSFNWPYNVYTWMAGLSLNLKIYLFFYLLSKQDKQDGSKPVSSGCIWDIRWTRKKLLGPKDSSQKIWLIGNATKQNLLTLDSGVPENGCKFSSLALSLVTGLMNLWYGGHWEASAISCGGSSGKSSQLGGHSICSVLPPVSEQQERETSSNFQVRKCQVSVFVTNNTTVWWHQIFNRLFGTWAFPDYQRRGVAFL